MRKASMVLGIVGGVVAILVALFAILGGVLFSTVNTTLFEENIDEESYSIDIEDYRQQSKVGSIVFIVIGSIIFIAGLLGIIGGIIVKKNNIAAGVMMLIGRVITLIAIWAILAFIPLLLGGIFALVKDNSSTLPQTQYQGTTKQEV